MPSNFTAMVVIWFTFFITILLFMVDLDSNCDNTRDLHHKLRIDVYLMATFKVATKITIPLLMCNVTSGSINGGKDIYLQMISSDY